MRQYHILGVMSGSSLDALDMALVRFEVEDAEITSWDLIAADAIPLSDAWNEKLAGTPDSIDAFFRLHVDFGKLIGESCAGFISECGIKPDAICSHGHTLLHRPDAGYTVQIGHPAYIAALTGIPVITDLRSNDIAAGGQGAPLAPVVEKYCFPGYDYYLNLGGIANLSHFAHDGQIAAWDICPCNQLLNFVAAKTGRKYDDNGALARGGTVDPGLLAALKQPLPLPLQKPFSLDNAWLRDQYLPLLSKSQISPEDQLATLTELIAQSVALQISVSRESQRAGRLLITGGGAHNGYLVERISSVVTPVEVILPDAQIIDFKEAILMALCGMLRLLGKPNAFASVTGARRDTVNGMVTA